MKPDTKTLEKLFEIIIAFHNEKDYFDLLDVVLTKMMELTNADAGTLYIVEDGMLHFRILRNISMNIYRGGRDKIDLPPILIDENNINNICAYAAVNNETVAIDDVYNSSEFNFTGPKNYDKITGYRTCSMLVFPLTAGSLKDNHEVIGVIQLLNSIDENTGAIVPFTGIYDPPFLFALSNMSANALANLKHTKEIKELFNSFVRVMTKAVDERSPYTVNHTNNVARYCDNFALYLNKNFPAEHEYYFTQNRREQLFMAALLHDIGKIITPLDIMDKPDRLGGQIDIIQLKFEIKKVQLENSFLKKEIDQQDYEARIKRIEDALTLIKTINDAQFLSDQKIQEIRELELITYTNGSGEELPLLTPLNMDALTIRKGTLTDAERNIMQEHVSVTERLLEQMDFTKIYANVPVFAKDHHEFLDASGYPRRLRGSEIALDTCILSLTDIYDALTARDRPYKKALPPERALGVIEEMAREGKLHQDLVRLFIESGVWKGQGTGDRDQGSENNS